jgi:hypothetical protein
MSAPSDLPTDPSPDASASAARDSDYSAALKELAARSERFKTESNGRLKVADRELADRLTVSERRFDALGQRESRLREDGRVLSVLPDANSAPIRARQGGC